MGSGILQQGSSRISHPRLSSHRGPVMNYPGPYSRDINKGESMPSAALNHPPPPLPGPAETQKVNLVRAHVGFKAKKKPRGTGFPEAASGLGKGMQPARGGIARQRERLLPKSGRTVHRRLMLTVLPTQMWVKPRFCCCKRRRQVRICPSNPSHNPYVHLQNNTSTPSHGRLSGDEADLQPRSPATGI